jgi:hypothetical protein
MKKLTKEEALRIPVKPHVRHNIVRAYLLNMQPGDIILIERHEWKWKRHSPSVMTNEIAKRKRWKFTCNTAMDGTGWVIERLK